MLTNSKYEYSSSGNLSYFLCILNAKKVIALSQII